MGTLVHGGAGKQFEIEDRLLSHLKVIVGMKLSRGESFFLSWERSASEGSGSISLWLSPSTPVQFRFQGTARPELNQKWLKAMADNSFGPGGLVLTEEPEPEPAVPARAK